MRDAGSLARGVGEGDAAAEAAGVLQVPDGHETTLTRREVVRRGAAGLLAGSLVGRLAWSDVASAALRAPGWRFGAFIDPEDKRTMTFAEAARARERLEALVGRRLDLSSTFVAWSEPFPNAGHVADRDAGRTPLVNWEGRRDLTAIASGRHDALLRERARECREFRAPLYVRWAAEFNGEWNPAYGKPRQFVGAWRHLVRTFRDAGATNVRWVWCPFAVQSPSRWAEEWRRYYPGDGFVDRVGMDGYNWGTSRPWSRWQSFSEIFGPLYRDYAGRKPLMICEVASAEVGGDKAAWIRAMGAELAGRFSKVDAVMWFHANKETDWRIDSSDAALRAFRSIAV
jgi:hypothetical protein